MVPMSSAFVDSATRIVLPDCFAKPPNVHPVCTMCHTPMGSAVREPPIRTRELSNGPETTFTGMALRSSSATIGPVSVKSTDVATPLASRAVANRTVASSAPDAAAV